MLLTLLPYLFAALAAGGFWVYEKATIAGLRTEVSSLQSQIDDPTTGWRKQLSVCTENEGKYEVAIRDISAKMVELGEKQRDVAAAQAKVLAATAAGARTTADTVKSILAAPSRGPDVCANALAIQREPIP
jgi:hypothetical protein